MLNGRAPNFVGWDEVRIPAIGTTMANSVSALRR